MASHPQRLVNPARRIYGSTSVPFSRHFSADSLVEIKSGEIGKVSGIPEEHLRRRVVIFSPARTATQQGSGKVGSWKINFMSTQKTPPPSQPSNSGAYYSSFHTNPERRKFSKDEWDKFTKDSTKKALEELVSSPNFSKWAVANAERITLSPNEDTVVRRGRWLPWF